MGFFKKIKGLFKKIFFRPKRRRRFPSRKVKKRISKKTPRRSVASKPKKIQAKKPANSKPPHSTVGEITHFFPRIQVCVLKVSATEIKVGDQILIAGKKSRFTQKVSSLQIESIDVKSAKRGSLVGLKLDKPAEAGDKVFKMTP